MTDQEIVDMVARAIRDMCQEHEIVGVFQLCRPTHCANGFLFKQAPWNRVTLEVDSEGAVLGFRVRSKLDEYLARGLDEAAARQAQSDDIAATITALDFIGREGGVGSLLALQAHEMMRERFHSKTTSGPVKSWGDEP